MLSCIGAHIVYSGTIHGGTYFPSSTYYIHKMFCPTREQKMSVHNPRIQSQSRFDFWGPSLSPLHPLVPSQSIAPFSSPKGSLQGTFRYCSKEPVVSCKRVIWCLLGKAFKNHSLKVLVQRNITCMLTHGLITAWLEKSKKGYVSGLL